MFETRIKELLAVDYLLEQKLSSVLSPDAVRRVDAARDRITQAVGQLQAADVLISRDSKVIRIDQGGVR